MNHPTKWYKMRWKYVLYVICIISIIGTSSCIYSRYKLGTLCSDADIIGQLHDEVLPEFVLDGVYYSLPCPLSHFLDNGWEVLYEYEPNVENTGDKGSRRRGNRPYKRAIRLVCTNYQEDMINDSYQENGVTVYTNAPEGEGPEIIQILSIEFNCGALGAEEEFLFVTWKGMCGLTTMQRLDALISSEKVDTVIKVIENRPVLEGDTLYEYQIMNDKGQAIIFIETADFAIPIVWKDNVTQIRIPQNAYTDGVEVIRVSCGREE